MKSLARPHDHLAIVVQSAEKDRSILALYYQCFECGKKYNSIEWESQKGEEI